VVWTRRGLVAVSAETGSGGVIVPGVRKPTPDARPEAEFVEKIPECIGATHLLPSAADAREAKRMHDLSFAGVSA
jgi:hypothetical protein